MFNFSKNIKRINDTKNVFVGIQQIENQYLLNEVNSNEYAYIYYPDIKKNKKNGWQGRLCWDTPFICSYNKLNVSKKNGYLIINRLKKLIMINKENFNLSIVIPCYNEKTPLRLS